MNQMYLKINIICLNICKIHWSYDGGYLTFPKSRHHVC